MDNDFVSNIYLAELELDEDFTNRNRMSDETFVEMDNYFRDLEQSKCSVSREDEFDAKYGWLEDLNLEIEIDDDFKF